MDLPAKYGFAESAAQSEILPPWMRYLPSSKIIPTAKSSSITEALQGRNGKLEAVVTEKRKLVPIRRSVNRFGPMSVHAIVYEKKATSEKRKRNSDDESMNIIPIQEANSNSSNDADTLLSGFENAWTSHETSVALFADMDQLDNGTKAQEDKSGNKRHRRNDNSSTLEAAELFSIVRLK